MLAFACQLMVFWEHMFLCIYRFVLTLCSSFRMMGLILNWAVLLVLSSLRFWYFLGNCLGCVVPLVLLYHLYQKVPLAFNLLIRSCRVLA